MTISEQEYSKVIEGYNTHEIILIRKLKEQEEIIKTLRELRDFDEKQKEKTKPCM